MAAAAVTEHGDVVRRRLRIDSRRRWLPDFRALFHASDLLRLLARRDITVRYRQTALGAVWIIAGPLLSAGLFSFVFGRVADLSSEGEPYFAFSYAALLAWNLFSETLMASSRSLTANSGLVTKIYFPRLVLPLSTASSTLVNAALSVGVMLVLLVVYDIGFTLRILLLPAWILLALGLAMGLGLVVTSISVFFRDVNYVTQVAIPLLLFLTPVAYSTAEVPDDVRVAYLLNPVATIVEGCRWSLLGDGYLRGPAVVYTVAVTVIAVVAGLMAFARLERGFADVV